MRASGGQKNVKNPQGCGALLSRASGENVDPSLALRALSLSRRRDIKGEALG